MRFRVLSLGLALAASGCLSTSHGHQDAHGALRAPDPIVFAGKGPLPNPFDDPWKESITFQPSELQGNLSWSVHVTPRPGQVCNFTALIATVGASRLFVIKEGDGHDFGYIPFGAYTSGVQVANAYDSRAIPRMAPNAYFIHRAFTGDGTVLRFFAQDVNEGRPATPLTFTTTCPQAPLSIEREAGRTALVFDADTMSATATGWMAVGPPDLVFTVHGSALGTIGGPKARLYFSNDAITRGSLVVARGSSNQWTWPMDQPHGLANWTGEPGQYEVRVERLAYADRSMATIWGAMGAFQPIRDWADIRDLKP